MTRTLLLPLALIALPTAVLGQPSVDSLLERPPSPVAEALLVAHASDPRLTARWSTALGHESAVVRAVVARAVQAAGLDVLLEPLLTQLARETDLAAAVEQVETLVVLSKSLHPGVEAAIDRHGAPLAASVLRALARSAPSTLLDVLPRWRDRGYDVELAQRAILEDWLRRSSPHAVRMQSALIREGGASAWRIVVGAGERAQLPVDANRLSVALRSEHPQVPDLAVAAILTRPADEARQFVAGPAVTAVVDDLLQRLSTLPPSTQVVGTLLARRLGRPDTGVALLAAATAAKGTFLRRLSGTQLGDLTAEERTALTAAWGEPPAAPRTTTETKPSGPTAQMIAGLPPRLLDEVVGSVGCRRRDDFVQTRAQYGEDGRVVDVAVTPGLLSGKCVAAFTSLVTLTRASGPGVRDVFVPRDEVFGKAFATRTTHEPRSLHEWYMPGDIAVTTPFLKRSVKPAYSREAMAAMAEGKVLLDALVDDTGTVVETNVLAGAHPTLNTPAIHTMPQWRFVPALENGRAVPVRVTVQMEFTLKNKPRR